MDTFDTTVFVVFAALCAWLLVVLVLQSSRTRIWTGIAGPNAGDQMQYLGWIQQAAHHLLISNPFDTRPARADYLQPGVAISGLLVRLGVTPSLSYLLWEPVALVALFGAVRAFIHRLLAGTWQRRFALVISLFYVSPVAYLGSSLFSWLPNTDRFFLQATVTEMWPILYFWGYPFTALSVAALVWGLLIYERDRNALRFRPWAPLLGLICAWLQPWQGATLLVVLVLSESLMWLYRQKNGLALPAITIAATALPLIYYSVLSHVDPSWSLAGRVDFTVIPWATIIVSLVPLGVPALLAYRRPPKSFQHVSVRVWPVAALALYWFISLTHVGTFPLHALQGLSVPFAVLSVVGFSSLHLKLSAVWKVVISTTLVTALIIPSSIQNLNGARSVGDPIFGPEPIFVNAGEWAALNYLKDSPISGAVLSPVYLGQAVPGITGRLTWVGIYSWTPSFAQRSTLANELFSGSLGAPEESRIILSTHARFLLSDCRHHADLAMLLPAILEPGKQFGCATVYQVRPFP